MAIPWEEIEKMSDGIEKMSDKIGNISDVFAVPSLFFVEISHKITTKWHGRGRLCRCRCAEMRAVICLLFSRFVVGRFVEPHHRGHLSEVVRYWWRGAAR